MGEFKYKPSASFDGGTNTFTTNNGVTGDFETINSKYGADTSAMAAAGYGANNIRKYQEALKQQAVFDTNAVKVDTLGADISNEDVFGQSTPAAGDIKWPWNDAERNTQIDTLDTALVDSLKSDWMADYDKMSGVSALGDADKLKGADLVDYNTSKNASYDNYLKQQTAGDMTSAEKWGLGAQVVGAGINAYQAYEAHELAKDKLDEDKKQFGLNYDASMGDLYGRKENATSGVDRSNYFQDTKKTRVAKSLAGGFGGSSGDGGWK